MTQKENVESFKPGDMVLFKYIAHGIRVHHRDRAAEDAAYHDSLDNTCMLVIKRDSGNNDYYQCLSQITGNIYTLNKYNISLIEQ